MIIPTDVAHNIAAEQIAQTFRAEGISTAVDLSDRKVGKKIEKAAEAFVTYALVLGEDELKMNTYTVKNLEEKSEFSGTLGELIGKIVS
jgi:threonyl-tRNA synthetase